MTVPQPVTYEKPGPGYTMKKAIPIEFIYQVFSLLIAIIIVHAVYVAVIRPNASAFMEREVALMKADSEYVQQRSIFVVVRDFEQEACFILALWAFSIMGYKGYASFRERKLLDTLVDGEDDDADSVLDTAKLS
jgi:hypothetical protein